MHRRTLLRWLLSGAAAWPLRGIELHAHAADLSTAGVATLRALAAVVLPSALGAAGHDKVVGDFVQWLASYQPGAERGYGYGHPRRAVTPAIDTKVYESQLMTLGALAALPVEARRTKVIESLNASGARTLPGSPNGGHIITDFMSFYFSSGPAVDVVYRARIGSTTCRGLGGAAARPVAVAGD
jgi:hypothetical protein